MRSLHKAIAGISPVAIMVFVAVSLAAARVSAAGDAPPPQVEVRFCYWANFVENRFIQEVCDDFERENPTVKIKREWFVGDYGRKLQLVMLTGKAADILLMDDEIFPAYSERGYIENLRPYIDRRSDETECQLADELQYTDTPKEQRDPNFKRVFLPTALESFNYKGFQGGLPWDGNVELVFYNKDLFDQAHEPYPTKDWTWAQFREMAKRFTKDLDGDGNLDQFGTNLSFGFLGFEPIVWSFGGDILNPDRTRSAIQLPPAVEAGQFIYDMKIKDRSIAWSGQMEGFLTEVQLLTGRVAIVPSMSYMIPALNRVEGAMRWGVAPMPIGPHGDRYTRMTWDGISIYSGATPEKKEIAWRFLKYFLAEKNQAIVGRTQRGLPVRRADALKYYIDPKNPEPEEIAIEATEYARLTPITPRYQELRDTATIELDRLEFADATGATVAESFARLGPQINLVMEKELADWREKNASALQSVKATGSGLKALGVTGMLVAALIAVVMMFPPVRRGLKGYVTESRWILRSRLGRGEAFEGILFAAPWLVGLVLFQAFPILFSIVLSFCKWDPYDPISKMQFIGLGNYFRAFSVNEVTGDPLVRKALYNTFYYAFFAVPLGICTSLGLALLLNQKVRGITIFRTAFYLPSIVAGVATVILWMYIFNPTFGPLNTFLRAANVLLQKSVILSFIHLPVPMWMGDPHWTKPALILMTLWGAGGAGMLIFLAGLQGVPDMLYEVAELDGAGRWQKFWNITLPMLTPTIYFNLVMGVIGALKVFMQAFIMTEGNGGVDKSLLFFVLHLYNKAFVEYEMGYASALAWILFVIILAFTLLVIRSSALWVYYEGERKP